MKQFYGATVTLELPGRVHTEPIALEKAGVQGGVNISDIWNIMIEEFVEPLAIKWKAKGWGAKTGCQDNRYPTSYLLTT